MHGGKIVDTVTGTGFCDRRWEYSTGRGLACCCCLLTNAGIETQTNVHTVIKIKGTRSQFALGSALSKAWRQLAVGYAFPRSLSLLERRASYRFTGNSGRCQGQEQVVKPPIKTSWQRCGHCTFRLS